MRISIGRATGAASLIATVAVALLTIASCGGAGDQTLTLGQPGASNHTPSVAADGAVVALAWITTGTEGQADAFVAMSTDSGATFGPAVRANDVAGEVKAAEQQAPRVAVRNGTVAVLWTSKRASGTEMRVALSRDRGQSFAASTAISPSGAAGTRGWGSILIDDAGHVQAVWLDTRLSAAASSSAKPAADHPMSHADHMAHGGAAMSSTRQDAHWATIGDDGVSDDKLVATAVCFCCKTAIAGSGATLSAAFRDIYPESQRDISLARLGAGGDPARVRVADDGWKLNGCPEDGPAMAADASGGMHIAWPTKVSDTPAAKGIFYAETADGKTFSPRFRLDGGSGSSSHPSIAAGSNNRILAVWENSDGELHAIQIRERRNAQWTAGERISGDASAGSPSVAALPAGFIVAWESKAGAGSSILVRRRP